jgi:hypothetical protein
MNTLDIETRKKRIEANWRMEELDEVPFTIEVGPMHMGTSKFYCNPQAEVEWSLDHERKREGLYDYGFPNIKPNQGINIVAAAFGCECTVNDEADPWVKCLIREENTDDVYKLKVPDPANNRAFEQAWKHVEALEKLSSMPLRVVNIPSPLVTASLIWDYTSFIEALLIFPDEVHALLEKVTENLAELWFTPAGTLVTEYSKKLIEHFGRKGIFIQTSTPTREEALILGETLHEVLSR